MNSIRIQNCFDSHVHWLATGLLANQLNLSHLKSATDSAELDIQSSHYRGDWLIGFGWDQSDWKDQEFPRKEVLDQKFPDTPVCFTRADGHASWVNSEAIRRANILDEEGKLQTKYQNIMGGEIKVDQEGRPTGVLIDLADPLVKNLIPKIDKIQTESFLNRSTQIFNGAGFTHVRDLTCCPVQWEVSRRLEDQGQLTLAIEQFFSAEDPDKFETVLDFAVQARKDQKKLIRACGMKVYMDGALGSDGALLSHNYPGSKQNGLKFMNEERLEFVMRKTWENNFTFAIHTIGDEAAHIVISKACELWDSGLRGKLNLEHAQVLRDESILMLKGRDVHCYIQPCHWLTDKKWLKYKLGDLYSCAFPWAKLEECEISFSFGSDSPIERPSVFDNIKAVEDAELNGILPPSKEVRTYHCHPEMNWVKDCYTDYKDESVAHCVFQGQTLK